MPKALWDKKKLPNYQTTIEFILCWPSTAEQRGLPLSVACVSSETRSERTNFSTVSSYQLEVASGLGMGGLVSTSPLGTGDPSGLAQCRPCVCCHLLCELIVCVSPLVLEGLISLVFPSSLALTVFPSLPLQQSDILMKLSHCHSPGPKALGQFSVLW